MSSDILDLSSEDTNYDEQAVLPYSLPPLLVTQRGLPVADRQNWVRTRRPELLELFTNEVYGRVPEVALDSRLERVALDEVALGGHATHHELDLTLSHRRHGTLTLRLSAWIPNRRSAPCPTFLGLNFFGNHTVHPGPNVRLAAGWIPNEVELGITDHHATSASRGAHARRWPIELIVSRGHALVTLYAGDVTVDCPHRFREGAHRLLGVDDAAGDRPGSLATWAWGLSRVLDALYEFEDVDASRVAVIGHSRFGKAALWAAARDERFAIAISNQSGCGGASLSRRRFGEQTRDINHRFPHWFAPNFRKYDDRVEQLPVDQHQLLALLAPRPLYVSSAELDLWADPRGELRACWHASPAYQLFGLTGLLSTEPREPIALGLPIGEQIGYHRRPGRHDLLPVDWWHYLAFCERHFAHGANV